LREVKALLKRWKVVLAASIKKKSLIILLMLAIVSISSIAVATMPIDWDRLHPGPEEGYKPLMYDLDPQKTSVKIPLEEAIEKVKAVWSVPSDEVTGFRLRRDDWKDHTRWELEWRVNGSGLMADVDAETGKVMVIVDHRRSGGVDNLKDLNKAIELAKKVLMRLEIGTEDLSTPIVMKNDDPKFTYVVIWKQFYKGITVKTALVIVEIDAETLKPVGFGNGLMDMHEVNTVSKISENQAIEIAVNFLESETIKSKGYNKCKILKTELVIARPDYDPSQDKILIPMGKPTLVWYMYTSDDITGRLLDVMIDAQTGSVVGFSQYR